MNPVLVQAWRGEAVESAHAGSVAVVDADGGVLVSSGEVIARLNSAGEVTHTYGVPGEAALWSGLDLADNDTTFWVGNYFTSNVHKFNLATGARLASVNIATPSNTVVGIRVVR